MSYDNTNSGALFRNKRKDKPNHPDYTGRIDADGKEFWVSSWIKTSKAGEKFMSIALTPVDEEKPAVNTDELDGDIPF